MANYHPLKLVNRFNESALDKADIVKIVEIQERETDLWRLDQELDDRIEHTKQSLLENFGDVIGDMKRRGFTEQEALNKVRLIAFHN